jgi:hypothetical protein
MIGTRGAFSGAITLAMVAVGLGPGGPRPEVALGADRLVAESARAADTALASVETTLGTVFDTAREGAAAIVAGDGVPGESLQEAAGLLLDAAALAAEAESTVRGLDAARRARDPAVEAVPPGPDSAVLGSISAQLAATIEAADRFAEMRRRAVSVPVALDAALEALGQGDLDAADDQVATAAADQDAVAAWDVDFAALPIWVEATDDTIAAVQRLLAAVRDGDTAAAERAAADFAALADEATRADRALQITISEGGGTVAAAPLSRLADARERLVTQRAAVSAVLAGEAR